uniref:Sodium/potassium/calcium exchanger 4 n=2 Tax=Parasteatoda tepidariorum TaxID=114398 RepID=A0A2L2Y2X5_PARTP
MLAIVCDKYFVPCLNVISSYFKVPSDIAGATFMAVGASSPELFSSVIGAFVTEGDIGVGTVVGSAVFNILAVTGAAAFTVGKTGVELDWFPISRDTTMYIITISALVVIIHDNLVTWIEALILIIMFMTYLILLYFNTIVQDVTTKKAKNVQDWWLTKKGMNLDSLPLFDERSALLVANRLAHRYHSGDSACPSSTTSTSFMASDEMTTSGESNTLDKESGQFKAPILVPQLITEKYIIVKDLDEDDDMDAMKKLNNDFEESMAFNLMEVPKGGCFSKFFFFIMWIPNLVFSITIPNCSTIDRIRWFPLTFLGSILWLGVLSYLIFWMVAIIGYTLGIPDTISGLTILAAGTCVPELVSSVIVVRNGLGNMALCNLLGSNIFDILFCLGVPWLIKTLMNSDTKSLVINSSALTYTSLLMLVVVVFFYLSLLLCNWKLNWRYGVAAFVIYACFLVTASMFEGNVLGNFNPPTCNS